MSAGGQSVQAHSVMSSSQQLYDTGLFLIRDERIYQVLIAYSQHRLTNLTRFLAVQNTLL